MAKETVFGYILRQIEADYRIASTCYVVLRTRTRMDVSTCHAFTRDSLETMGGKVLPQDPADPKAYRIRFIA